MAKYRVAKGSRLAHSDSVLGGAGKPPATSGRVYEAGDEIELPEVEGTRLVSAGVLEKPVKRKSK